MPAYFIHSIIPKHLRAPQPGCSDHSRRNSSFQLGTEPGSGCGDGQGRPGWCLCSSPTLLELAEADGAGVIPVILLEEAPPLLDEAQQGGEAVDVDAPRPRLVEHVWAGRGQGGVGKAAEASRELRIPATAPRNPALIPKIPPLQGCHQLGPFNPQGW